MRACQSAGMLAVAVIASLVVVAHGHGAVVNPPYVIIHTFGNTPCCMAARAARWRATGRARENSLARADRYGCYM